MSIFIGSDHRSTVCSVGSPFLFRVPSPIPRGVYGTGNILYILPVLRIRIQLGLHIRIRIWEGNKAPSQKNE
jgi:hypothetical protein